MAGLFDMSGFLGETMSLHRIRKLGRYRNPDTGNPVNVHKGYRGKAEWPVYFWLLRGKRQIIGEREFRETWKQVDARVT